jgi:hypothetical protein
MNFDYRFPLFDDILHGRLNPLLSVNTEDYNCVKKPQKMVIVSAIDIGVYSNQFFKPPTLKVRYYQQKLLSETFCNKLSVKDFLISDYKM